MSFFGRLIGKQPPKVPAGGQPFVGRMYSGEWCIRYTPAGQERDENNPRVKGSPTFTSLMVANDYLDWVTGEAASFSYPAGAA